MNKLEIVFIRKLPSEPEDKLPCVRVGYVSGHQYVGKGCFYDPSVIDGMASQLWMAGLEASREIEAREGLERGDIGRSWDLPKARSFINELCPELA